MVKGSGAGAAAPWIVGRELPAELGIGALSNRGHTGS